MIRSKGLLPVQLLILLLPIVLVTPAYGQNNKIKISLDKNLTWANKEIYAQITILNASSTIEVEFTDTNSTLAFIILQVHVDQYNVTLYNNTLARNSVIIGSSIGLYSSVKPKLDKFYIYNQNEIEVNISINVHGYDKNDPIPGGCAMEGPTAISPYIQTTVNYYFIEVGLAPPRESIDPDCKFTKDVTVVFYRMYYYPPLRTLDSVKTMMTLDKILENAVIIEDNGEAMRRKVARYGVSVVYVAVAYSNIDKSAYSVYVPTLVHRCSYPEEKLPFICAEGRIDNLYFYICLIVWTIGVFVTLVGHYFFKIQMFLNGMLSGVVVTYIVISLIADLGEHALLSVSVMSGVGFGAIWLLFWWFYGLPMFSFLLPTLNCGFLVACVVYYVLPGDILVLQGDLEFWTFFISIMLLTSMILLLFVNYNSQLLCSALLGAYTFLFAFDYVIDISLSRILTNTVRRAVVPGYNKVIQSPPFEFWEGLNVGFLVFLVLSGGFLQYLRNVGHPPFPPPPRGVRASMPGLSYGAINKGARRKSSVARAAANNERAPLLA